MKRRYYILLVLLILSVIPKVSFANNIVVENVSLVDKDTDANTYNIQFDVAWDNSWFAPGAPSATANWDAAWVFAKYSFYSAGTGTWSDWAHCKLSTSDADHYAPTGSTIKTGVTGSYGMGVFIYRASSGSGSVDWNGAKIRWVYGTDVPDDATVSVKVFAIEMVYIPTCNFYVGDGTNRTGGSNSHFFDAADATDPRDPVLITSTPPYISSVNDGTGTAGDITWVNESTYAGNLPVERTQLGANYPTGYNAFYIMKYEISQRQYCEFLNTLTSTQADNRWATGNFNSLRYFIKKASNGKFGCDANNNAGADGSADYTKLNESNDGEWIACNWLSWADGAAYADWAALRPFTELEVEKAARGGQTVYAFEYAWGDDTLETATSSLTKADTTSEVPNQGNLNYTSCSPNGPFRCGSYADATSTRANAGAGYYGALDLSGNLWERPVCVMASQTGTTVSTFEGTHGDGSLSSTGFATNSDWPGTVAAVCGYRAGGWGNAATDARVSDRSYVAHEYTDRGDGLAGRCARTSP